MINYIIKMAKLYISYDNGSWNEYQEKMGNRHQKQALDMFVASGLDTQKINIPHSLGGMFTVTFTKLPATQDCPEIYYYTREDKSIVTFVMMEPDKVGFINRVSKEPI
jgi:hypothetical protein